MFAGTLWNTLFAQVARVGELLIGAAGLEGQAATQVIGRVELAVEIAVRDRILLHVQALDGPEIRVLQVDAIGVDRDARAGVVAERRLLRFHEHLVEHRLGEVRLLIAAQGVDGEPLADLPAQIGDALIEVGVVLDDVMLGPQVDARVARRAQRVGVVDHRAADHLRAADAGAGQRIAARGGQRIVVAIVPQTAIEEIDVELEIVARMILNRGGDAEAAAIGVPG